jgi:hypothetical protein
MEGCKKSHRFALQAICTGLLGLSATGLASAQGDMEISVAGSVPLNCVVAQVTRAEHAAGSVVTVATNCNAPGFRIEFDGVPGLYLSAARPGQNAGATVTVFSDAVELNPTSPDFQIIEVDFSNTLAELDSLIVDVAPS